MEPAQTIKLNENNPQQKSPQKRTNNFGIFFVLSFLIIFFSCLALATGYLWGKFQSLPPSKTKETASKQSENKKVAGVYEDKENSFKLNYPNDWKAAKRNAGIPGVIISKEKSSVEVWLSVDQPITFSSEQRAAFVTTNNLRLKVDGQTATMTENIYTAGNYFSVIKLSAVQDSPLVTIWIKAESQEVYTQAKVIAQSFSFN